MKHNRRFPRYVLRPHKIMIRLIKQFVNWFLPKKTILFVCTGNTCRSPMAAALANKMLKGTRYRAESAGLSAFVGEYPSQFAVEVMAEYGVDISKHLTRQVNLDIISSAFRVYGMSASHVASMKVQFPSATNIFTFGEIEDPFGGDIDDYRLCAEQIYNRLTWIINNEIADI